jgi:hypothetical protein
MMPPKEGRVMEPRELHPEDRAVVDRALVSAWYEEREFLRRHFIPHSTPHPRDVAAAAVEALHQQARSGGATAVQALTGLQAAGLQHIEAHATTPGELGAAGAEAQRMAGALAQQSAAWAVWALVDLAERGAEQAWLHLLRDPARLRALAGETQQDVQALIEQAERILHERGGP